MSWFFQSDEAKEHKKNCKKDPWSCGKCIWIDESHSAAVDVWEEKQNIEVVEEQEPEMVWDKSIRRYTKGGKLCD